jgi:hypothetical protein
MYTYSPHPKMLIARPFMFMSRLSLHHPCQCRHFFLVILLVFGVIFTVGPLDAIDLLLSSSLVSSSLSWPLWQSPSTVVASLVVFLISSDQSTA